MPQAKLSWFTVPGSKPKGWSNQELAEFYRIMDIMVKAGLTVDVDQGLSDEGDPWFVFVRKATSDVIAHFARIDNRFVSVSSLNQEIYSGSDIRSVVDQMLQRHPLMLPMQRGDGQLFLHPGVVLTAFVAAAFLTAVDGSGSRDIKHIIAATFSNTDTQNINDTGWPKLDFIRGEIVASNMRSAGWEANQTSPNMVLLGAALMAQENWVEFNKTKNKITPADGDQKVSAGLISEIFYLSESDDTEGLELDLNNAKPDLDSKTQAASFKFNKQENQVIQEGQEKQKSETFEWFWSPEKAVSIQITGLSENIKEDQGGVIQTNSTERQPLETGMLPPKYLGFKEGLYAHTKEYSGLENSKHEMDFSSDVLGSINNFVINEFQFPATGLGLGVTVTSDGEFSLVTMKSAPLANERDVNFDIFVKAYEDSSSFNEHPVVSTISFPEEEVVSSGSNLDDSMQVPQSTLPIVGHRLSGYGTNKITLSDSIDVLFYDGGDMRVEGFELGKDLLWFFLPEEAVVQADRRIVEGGDLSLELEGIGNLTFVGLLNSDDNSFLL